MKAYKTYHYLKEKIKKSKEYIKLIEEDIQKYQAMIDEILEEKK